MNLWYLVPSEKYRILLPNSKIARWFMRHMGKGVSYSLQQPVELIDAPDRGNSNYPLPDIISLSMSGLLVREHVKALFESPLAKCGEWIECVYSGEVLWYFNTTACLDIMDKERTEFVYSNGILVDVKSYAFKPCDLSDYPVFKLVGEEQLGPYVTEAFVKLFEDEQLTGMEFVKLRCVPD